MELIDIFIRINDDIMVHIDLTAFPLLVRPKLANQPRSSSL